MTSSPELADDVINDYLSDVQVSMERTPTVDMLTVHHRDMISKRNAYNWTTEEVGKVVKEYLGPQWQCEHYKLHHPLHKECPCCRERNQDTRRLFAEDLEEIPGKQAFPYDLTNGQTESRSKGKGKKPPQKKRKNVGCQVELLPSYSEYPDVDGFDRYAYNAAVTNGSTRPGNKESVRKGRSNPVPNPHTVPKPSQHKDIQTEAMPGPWRPVQHSPPPPRKDVDNTRTQMKDRDDGFEKGSKPIERQVSRAVHPHHVDELAAVEQYERKLGQPYLQFKHGHGVPMDESEYDRGIILAAYRYYRAMEKLDEHIGHI